MIDIANEYANLGLCVIPFGHKKKSPIVEWQQYQDKMPTQDDLNTWFKNGNNIGMVTGLISGICVIDIDHVDSIAEVNELIPDSLDFPVAKTQSGGTHYFFRCLDNNLQTKAGIEGFTKVDLRANGGVVVLPPSIGEKGKYEWIRDIRTTPIPILPEALYNMLPKKNISKPKEDIKPTKLLSEGSRDDDMFHLAWALVKSKMPQEEIYGYIMKFAQTCEPPFTVKEAEAKVLSAIRRAGQQPRDLQSEISAWCLQHDKGFKIDTLYRELDIISKEHKAEARLVLRSLKNKGIIESTNAIDIYKIIDKQIHHITIPEEDIKPMNLKFPLGIESLTNLYNGNIAVIAGTSNAGKTAFCLNFAKLNMDKYKVVYQSSEMDGQELKIKLNGFGISMDIFRDKIEWIKKGSDWWDVINPDAINIIDFMEIYDNFYEVGGWIKKIFDKLSTGICLIALQKRDSKTDDGRGGAITREKARLYLSMDYGRLKIVKAKHWAGGSNPNGLYCPFELEKGIILKNTSHWRHDENR